MLPRVRAIQLAIIAALVSPATGVLSAQQLETPDLVAAGVSIAYLSLSIGAIVRLAGQSREAKIGDRVRGRAVSTTGTVTAVGADSVTIRSEAGEARLARTDVQGLRLYEGSERKWAQGWGIGFLSGAAAGALAGAASKPPNENPSCDFICPSRSGNAILTGVAGSLAGSVVGALIGAAMRGERWSRISGFVEGTALQITPGSRALGVGARIRF